MPPLTPQDVHYCPGCVYSLRGLTSQRCPECGCDVSEANLRRLIELKCPSRQREVLTAIVLPSVCFAPTVLVALMLLVTSEKELLPVAMGIWVVGFFVFIVAGPVTAIQLARRVAFQHRLTRGRRGSEWPAVTLNVIGILIAQAFFIFSVSLLAFGLLVEPAFSF